MSAWVGANKYSLLGGLRGGGTTARVRAAVRAGRGERRDGGRHAQPVRHRRGMAAVVAAVATARARWCSSSPGWPRSAARRSTCRSPTPSWCSAIMTEYTGLRFAFFLLAEYVGIVVIAALTTVLFLGGWKGPFGDDAAGLAVDAGQGVRGVVRGDLAPGGLPPAARGPTAAAVLAGPGTGGAGPARAHRRRHARHRLSPPPAARRPPPAAVRPPRAARRPPPSAVRHARPPRAARRAGRLGGANGLWERSRAGAS